MYPDIKIHVNSTHKILLSVSLSFWANPVSRPFNTEKRKQNSLKIHRQVLELTEDGEVQFKLQFDNLFSMK